MCHIQRQYQHDAQAAEPQPDPTDVPHRGTPLAAVLLLIAVAAVAAAIVQSGLSGVTFDDRYRPLRRWRAPPAETPPDGLRWVDRDQVISAVIFFAALTAVVGTVVGLWHPPRVRRGLAGGSAGLVVGGATGLLLLCPPHFGAILSGAAVILAAAFAYQLVSRHPG